MIRRFIHAILGPSETERAWAEAARAWEANARALAELTEQAGRMATSLAQIAEAHDVLTHTAIEATGAFDDETDHETDRELS